MQAPAYFDAVLRPNRSLGRRGFVLLMSGLVLFSFIAGIAFISAGAWPVFGFLGLDVALIYLALRLNYRSGRLVETVRLTAEAIEVRRTDAYGSCSAWRAPPTWLRIELERPEAHDCRLMLRSHGSSLAIGSFLAPEERRDLAQALRHALRQANAAAAT